MTVEEASATLEAVAHNYPRDSKEYQAIELAAKALLFAYEQEVSKKFETYLREFGAELTPKQRQILISLGIELS